MRRVLFAAATLLAVCCSNPSRLEGPCDIYRAGGTPCVTAHSTTRLLDSQYTGPLYQVVRDSDGATLDVFAGPDGIADVTEQDIFCSGTVGRISVIYDQSGMGNDLLPAPPGTFQGPDKGGFNNPALADMAPVLLDGHTVYGVYIMPGMGYRCNDARGLAIDDEPEGIYYVIDGTHYDSGCCFDYGNSSTNGRAVGTGTMETTYYGTSTAWGRGNGEGPWIMADMEAGLFSGYGAKENDVPSITDWRILSVFVNGGGGNCWDLRGADALSDTLTTFYRGIRPGSVDGDAYYPMHKKGGMLLGNGGDNGNGSAGTFFEGVMTVGYPSEATLAAVQRNIAAADYRPFPLALSRITTLLLCSLMVSAEEVVLPAQRDGPDFVLCKVVVKQQPSVFKIAHHILPSGVGVGDGLAYLRRLAILHALRLHPHFHGLHDGFGEFLPLRLSLIKGHPCIVAHMLYPIEVLYLLQGMLRRLTVLVKCLLKVAADMYHAVDQAHVRAGLEGRLIARKTVAL